MKMTYDYLPGTQIYLHQRKDMFRMNTDTALLGNFMKVKEDESVLDIGTTMVRCYFMLLNIQKEN